MGKRNRNGRKGKGQNNNSGRGNNSTNKSTNKTDMDKDNMSGSNTSGEARHVHGRDKEQGANDVTWYTHIYPAAEPLSRVSFNVMTGSKYNPLNSQQVRPWSGPGHTTVSADSKAVVDPGIMGLYVQPVLGDNEAANTAATQIYSLMRRANAGSTNYDKTDLMMMIVGMDSAYMLYEYLLRAYRVCKSWDYLNKYTPEALLQAMGFHPSIMDDLANFESALNLFAYRLSTICVPDQFDFIHRHSWLFSNIYEDEDNGRAQTYLMIPSRFYIWTEGAEEEPTKLVPHNILSLYTPLSETYPANLICTTKQVNEIINNVMKPLVGSEDVGTMNGDLAKAFGDGGLIKINPVDNNPLIPVHNDEVLEQIMNADVLTVGNPNSIVYDDLSIKQDLSSLSAGPQLTQEIKYTPTNAAAPRNAVKSLLNAYDDISSDRIITSTRLKLSIEFIPGETEAGNREKIVSCGTEYVESVFMMYRDSSDGTFKMLDFSPRPYKNTNSIDAIIMASKFRYHPTMYVLTTMSGYWYYVGYIQDSAITTWLTDDWIEDMHNVCILSEYAVKDYKTGVSH